MTEVAKTLYGPRKLGDEAFAKQQAQKKLANRGGTVYGSRKGGSGPAPASTPDSDNPFLTNADPNSDGRITLNDLKSKLDEAPELLDVAIQAELQGGNPRKGAVKLFKEIEEKGAAREAVLQVLSAYL